MKKFMNEDFMLRTETASKLYHQHAKKPIIDYHCHLSPKEIASDRTFENISQIWLDGDHYKWRAMRNCGVDEKYITGDGTEYEKFYAFAQSMPSLIGNPLYHWCHLELQRYFDVDLILNEKNALTIWNACNEKLKHLRAKKIIEMSQVRYICTTDDPIDTLEYHRAIREDKDFSTRVLPAFRPDKALNIEKDGFAEYMQKLGAVYGKPIADIKTLQEALRTRIEHFNDNGCKASDHGLVSIPYSVADKNTINTIFMKAMKNETVSQEEAQQYKTDILMFLGREYKKHGWVMELHFGVARNVSQIHFSSMGPDTGYDAIGTSSMEGATQLLDALEIDNALPKTILYSANPIDNAAINAICACYQETNIKGKVQQGSAWWFNDSKIGIEEQLASYASMASLGSFVGMLTDSRSFLSYPRHEYFRRILCNYIGDLIENGEYPYCEEIGQIIEDICYNNAKRFFDLD